MADLAHVMATPEEVSRAVKGRHKGLAHRVAAREAVQGLRNDRAFRQMRRSGMGMELGAGMTAYGKRVNAAKAIAKVRAYGGKGIRHRPGGSPQGGQFY